MRKGTEGRTWEGERRSNRVCVGQSLWRQTGGAVAAAHHLYNSSRTQQRAKANGRGCSDADPPVATARDKR